MNYLLYKILHKLFGWHYITFSYGGSYVIRKVHSAPSGNFYIFIYGEPILLKKDNTFVNREGKYIPLTWESDNVNA